MYQYIKPKYATTRGLRHTALFRGHADCANDIGYHVEIKMNLVLLILPTKKSALKTQRKLKLYYLYCKAFLSDVFHLIDSHEKICFSV